MAFGPPKKGKFWSKWPKNDDFDPFFLGHWQFFAIFLWKSIQNALGHWQFLTKNPPIDPPIFWFPRGSPGKVKKRGVFQYKIPKQNRQNFQKSTLFSGSPGPPPWGGGVPSNGGPQSHHQRRQEPVSQLYVFVVFVSGAMKRSKKCHFPVCWVGK